MKKAISISIICISVLLFIAALVLSNDSVKASIGFDVTNILPILAIINLSLASISIFINTRKK